MSILSDLGTKIGAKLKELTTLVGTKFDKSGGNVTGTVNIGTSANGAQSYFQGLSTVHSGQPFLNVPWVYTHQIEAPDERGSASTGIAIGRDGKFNVGLNDDDTVSIYSQGSVRFRVQTDGISNFSTTPTINGVLMPTKANLDAKVDDSQVLTNVPAGALFTDTLYSKPTNEPISYISGLDTALDAKSDIHSHDYLPLVGGTISGDLATNALIKPSVGPAKMSFTNSGNTTIFETNVQVGHPTVLIKKSDDALAHNTALMITADADSGKEDSGETDVALDIRGYQSGAAVITDYTDITHRNAFITGAGTIWSKRYIDATLGLRENGVDISSKYLGITAKAADSELLDGLDSTQFARTDSTTTFNGAVNFTNDINFDSVGNAIYCKRDTNRRGSLAFTDENDITEWIQYHESNGNLEWSMLAGGGKFTVNNNEVLTTASSVNADTLDGLNSTQFARTDIPTTFNADINFNSNGNQIIIESDSTRDNLYWTRNGVNHFHMIHDAAGNLDLLSDSTGVFMINGSPVLSAASSINANTLDNLDSTQFLRSDTANGNLNYNSDGIYFSSTGNNYLTPSAVNLGGTLYIGDNTVGRKFGSIQLHSDTNPTINENTIWTAGNDGAGSGLDADKLDGLESTQLARTDIAETFAGNLTIANPDPILNINDTNNGTGGGFTGHISFNSTGGESFRIGDWAAVNETDGPDVLRIRNNNGDNVVVETTSGNGNLFIDTSKVMKGTKHISLSTPISTDGVDGDVWYQI